MPPLVFFFSINIPSAGLIQHRAQHTVATFARIVDVLNPVGFSPACEDESCG